MIARDPKLPRFQVAEEGIIAIPDLADGRFMPALVIDFHNNPQIEELIKLHAESKPGDVTCQWARVFSFGRCKDLVLNLEFSQPIVTTFGLEFNVERDYSLVDGIVHARGFWLISGKKGDSTATHVMAGNGITIEVPDIGFDGFWQSLLHKTIKAQYKTKGESRKRTEERVRQHIAGMRQVWNHRQT